jgi:hypothetical protein
LDLGKALIAQHKEAFPEAMRCLVIPAVEKCTTPALGKCTTPEAG